MYIVAVSFIGGENTHHENWNLRHLNEFTVYTSKRVAWFGWVIVFNATFNNI